MTRSGVPQRMGSDPVAYLFWGRQKAWSNFLRQFRNSELVGCSPRVLHTKSEHHRRAEFAAVQVFSPWTGGGGMWETPNADSHVTQEVLGETM